MSKLISLVSVLICAVSSFGATVNPPFYPTNDPGTLGQLLISLGSPGRFYWGSPTNLIAVSTNAISNVSGTNTSITTTVTNLDFWAGPNIVPFVTNRAGHIDVANQLLGTLTNNTSGKASAATNDPAGLPIINGYLPTTGGSGTNETFSGTTVFGGMIITNADSSAAVMMLGLNVNGRVVSNAVPSGSGISVTSTNGILLSTNSSLVTVGANIAAADSTVVVTTNAGKILLSAPAGASGTGIQTNSGTGFNNNLTNLTAQGSFTTTNAASGWQALPTGTNITFYYWGTNSAGVLQTNKLIFNPGALGSSFNLELSNTNGVDTFTVTQDGWIVFGTNKLALISTNGIASFAGVTNQGLTGLSIVASDSNKKEISIPTVASGDVLSDQGANLPAWTNTVPWAVGATNLPNGSAITTVTNGGFSMNLYARSNIVDQIQTWPTSTNQLIALPGSTSWLLQSATPTAQTNISGTLSATAWVFQSLIISNSTAAAFTNWITIPGAVAWGYAATNDAASLGFNGCVVPAAKAVEVMYKMRLGATNYAIINP